MTPREVMAGVFRFEEMSPVPYHIPIDSDVADRLDRHYGSDSWRQRLIPYLYGGHYVGHGTGVDVGDGCWKSPYGYVTRDPLSHLEQPALPRPTLDGYRWPDPESLADWHDLSERYKAADSSFRVCGMSFGFFERAMQLRGIEEVLMDMIENPQFVHDLLDGYLSLRLQLIDRIIDRIPVEGIIDGGDDCDQRGPMMGLQRWQEFIKPRLGAVIDHVHSKGLPVIAHMCGNVRPLVDDLLELKLDALESLQPEAMDIYDLKAVTRGKMVLVGGMGAQSTLPFGTPDEVTTETFKLLKEMGKGGGYVLGPSKPLLPDVPTENAVAFLETALSQKTSAGNADA